MREQESERRGEGGRGPEPLPTFQPFRGFRGLGFPAGRLGQLIDDLLGPSFGAAFGGLQGSWPAVDIEEDDESYCVCMEIPGVRREDLDIEVQNDVVTVRGEKRRSEKTGRSRWSERTYGAFARSFSLPPDADPEQASASFQDGVLTLRFHKREHARPRRIEIQEASRAGNGA